MQTYVVVTIFEQVHILYNYHDTCKEVAMCTFVISTKLSESREKGCANPRSFLSLTVKMQMDTWK